MSAAERRSRPQQPQVPTTASNSRFMVVSRPLALRPVVLETDSPNLRGLWITRVAGKRAPEIFNGR